MSSLQSQLQTRWEFTQISGNERSSDTANRGTSSGEWLPVDAVPTGVHEQLLKASRIPDPFVGLNEHLIQWINEESWAFRVKFTIGKEFHDRPFVDLVFDGLDTYATVELDGKHILSSSNMFVPYRIPLKSLLQDSSKDSEHDLLITFHSTFLKGRFLQRENADKTPVAHRGVGSAGGAGVLQGGSNKIPGPAGELALWNGDASRLHVRKAQYHYGWDWGPVIMCVGPWKPVHLEAYTTRVEELKVHTDFAEGQAKVTISATICGNVSDRTHVNIALLGPDGKTVGSVVVTPSPVEGGLFVAKSTISVASPKLWYPVGLGLQPLYVARAIIFNGDSELASSEKRIGLRSAHIVQHPLEGDNEGASFFFEVNGKAVFAGGSNWIPADSFLTTITPERYRAWLQLLIDGNQNMIRVWGGGIYEADAFYDACDELGILVWQDFMFGCGQYPAYEEFLQRVSAEVEANIKRLRHHPSIVIWAGNNEDYALAESIPLELDYSVEYPEVDFRKTSFPARYIYEVLLPSAVEKHSPQIDYHRGSPYSGSGKRSDDPKHGDIHQWNVWHGSQEPWHDWDKLAGRFISEFGMQGYPDIRTVDHWIGKDKLERYPQSRTMNSHNKADGFERRLELYLMENFKHAFDIESYVYYTQIMQAETLASAYRLWRREWRGNGKEYVGGALVWQLNDCWPVTSWAIADYFLRPKPAYFTIARELAPTTVGMTRKSIKTFDSTDSAAHFTIHSQLEVWATNSLYEAKWVKVELAAFDVEKGVFVPVEVDDLNDGCKEIKLAPNATTEVWSGKVPGVEDRKVECVRERAVVVQAKIVDIDTGIVLARYSNWPEPFKYLHFPTPEQVNLKIVPIGSTDTGAAGLDVTSLEITAERPIKGLVLDVEGAWARFSDQAIDVFPGDPQVVEVTGLEGRQVKARYLGDGSA